MRQVIHWVLWAPEFHAIVLLLEVFVVFMLFLILHKLRDRE